MKNNKGSLVPYFLGIAPSKYVRWYFLSLLIIPGYFLWAEIHHHDNQQIDKFFESILLPLNIGFWLIPILYLIHYGFYKGGSNRSGTFAQIALKNNLEYKAEDGLIIPQLKKVVDNYFFHSFSGSGLGSRDYIIGLNSDLKYYMFDYGYAVYSRKATYRYYKTIFMLECSKKELPRFRLKPKGFFDFLFGKNRKSELPKDYVDLLGGYYFWYDKEKTSMEDVIKRLPKEMFLIVRDHKGMIIEHFSNYLVINFNNCKIPSSNLSRFFDIGLSMKNALSEQV
tara:strand:- start:381 stop:1223 length:843 start_codon:yes stop_codon:yes gene_type:complete